MRTIAVHLSASIVRVYSSCQMSLKVAPNFTTTSMRRKRWRNHGMLRKKTPLTTARSNYSMIQTANSRNATQRQSRSGLKSIGNGRGKTKVRLRHSGSAGRMLIQSKLLKPPCRNNSSRFRKTWHSSCTKLSKRPESCNRGRSTQMASTSDTLPRLALACQAG